MKNILLALSFILGISVSLHSKNTNTVKLMATCTDTYESFVLTNLCDSLVSPSGSGKTWYTTGVYVDTILNVEGCDSVMTFNLTFGTTESFVLTNLCDSLVSPSGSGKTWYTSGVYMDTIPNAKGCDSVMTFNLTFGTTESFVIVNLCDSLESPSGSGKTWYTSGIYMDTIPNAKGCDSVMTFNLTFGTTESFVIVNLCDSLISPSGSGKTWYTSGIYMDTIPNAKGCDSVMTFNLTFGTTESFTYPNLCDSLVSPSGSGKVWYFTGIYKDTITNAKGCDSVMTFNLTIGHTSTANFIDYDICDFKISPSGKTWNVDGIYIDTIPNVSGCDSIMTFDLTFKYSTAASFTPPSICDSWVSPSGKTWNTTGVHMDTIPNSVLCDSVMTFNLTFKYSTTVSSSPSLCDSLVSPSGKIWKTTGVFKDTIPNAKGCDSLMTFNLTIFNPTPVTTVLPVSATVCSGDSVVLSGTCAAGTLKWFNDSLGVSLQYTGTSQTFFVGAPGNYTLYAFCEGTGSCLSVVPSKVTYIVNGIPMNPTSGLATPSTVCLGDSSILSAGGCVGGVIKWYDNSAGTGSPLASGLTAKVFPTVTKNYYAYCVMPGGCKSAFGTTVNVVVDPCSTGDISLTKLGLIQVYPNPFNDIVSVSINEELLKENLIIRVFNSVGQEITRINTKQEETILIDLSEYERGLYLLNITSANGKENKTMKLTKL